MGTDRSGCGWGLVLGFVDAVMNIQFSLRAGNSLTS